MYVATWATVDYTSVRSIMHCRHVTSLLHASTNVRMLVGSSEENGVGEDAVNTHSRVFMSGLSGVRLRADFNT